MHNGDGKGTRYGCRGPLLRTDEAQRPLFDQWYEIEQAGRAEAAGGFYLMLHEDAERIAGHAVPLPHNRLVDAVAHANWGELRRLTFPMIRLRAEAVGRPCGADLTPLIDAVPQDDAVHKLACPACGNAIEVRKVPETAPAAEEA